MHTVIRRYEGAGDSAEVCRRAVEGFAPMLAERPGFQGYWAVDGGPGYAVGAFAVPSADAVAIVLAADESYPAQQAALELLSTMLDPRANW